MTDLEPRPDAMRSPPIVIITGMSGAGKTSALRVFEDANYFTIDNLPPQLLDRFLALCLAGSNTSSSFAGMAVVIDIRAREFFEGLLDIVVSLKKSGIDVKIIFLDAKDHILVRRYKETRREHPLSKPGEPLEKAISRERALLSAIEHEANFTLDTSNLKADDLRKQIVSYISVQPHQAMRTSVRILSFGYKFGIPLDPDFVFDVRFLPNPFYVPELKLKSGMDPEVIAFIEKAPETSEFLKLVEEFLAWVLPKFSEDGRLRLITAIGCTGGQHRSVYIAEKLGEALRSKNYEVNVVHRDIGK